MQVFVSHPVKLLLVKDAFVPQSVGFLVKPFLVVFPRAAHTFDEVCITLFLSNSLFLSGFFQQSFTQLLFVTCTERERINKGQYSVQ